MKVFAPDRKNSACQETGGHILRCLSMGEPLEKGFGVWSLKIIGLTTCQDDSENNRKIKENRLGEWEGRNTFSR